MPRWEVTSEIAAPIGRIWDHMSNPAQYPGASAAVTVDGSCANERIVAVTAVLHGNSMRWTQREALDESNHRAEFVLISGDPARLRGSWALTQVGELVEATLSVDFDFGLPPISPIVDPYMEAWYRERWFGAARGAGQ